MTVSRDAQYLENGLVGLCSRRERSGKVSGAWGVKGTRVPADALVSNARDGYSAEQIVSDLFPTVPLESARRVLEFAGLQEARHEPHPS